jgi:type I restriction enzyme S subunit
MKKEWENITLGSVCDVFSGFAFKSNDLGEEGIPVLKIANIQGKKILSECKDSFPTSKIDGKLTKYFLEDDDILVAMTGAGSVGKIGKMRNKNQKFLVNQRVAIVRLKSDQANAEFVYQLLSQDKYEFILYNIGIGAGQPNISPEQIRNLIVPSPTIDIQNKIASILSAYDDLIENNTRRIKILEEMARLIYREWFMEFKAPGIKLRKATLEEKKVTGKDVFPDGWVVKRIDDQFQVVLGGTPSRIKQEYWENGSIPWINSSKVNELRIIEPTELISQLGYDNSATKLLPRRTTVLAITGATLGQVSMLEIESCANQSVVGIWDESKMMSEYLYLAIKESIHKIIKHAGGSAQPHINKEIVNGSKVIIPPDEIISQFVVIIRPMFNQIANMLFRNSNLLQTRDLLLPKLISGEVEV